MLKEQEFRIHRAEGRDEEQNAGNDKRPLAAEVGSKESGEGGTDNAADKGRGRRKAVPAVGIGEVL